MELSAYELFLVLSSLKYYSNSYDYSYHSNEVSELIDKIIVHLENLNK